MRAMGQPTLLTVYSTPDPPKITSQASLNLILSLSL